MQFQKQEVSCLEPCLSRIQTLEQTQEISFPEGGEGRVLGAWGQAVMRSKEWQRDTVILTGGVQAWILYETEEGNLQCLNSYIPFRMEWDLPSEKENGWIRIRPVVRNMDARPVSAGKLLIRVGIGALAEAFCSQKVSYFSAEDSMEGVELLNTHWPIRLWKEAGEKTFELEGDLTVPDSVPPVQRLLSWQLDIKVTDKKIMGNKIVFRGSGNIHAVYLSPEGQLRCWDFELPFSQYAELNQSYSTDARGDVAVAVTGLELEQDERGNLHLHADLTGQYLVEDRYLLETVEDAYSPDREITLLQETQKLPVLLDSRRETVSQRQTLSVSADIIADQIYYPDFPRQRREGQQLHLIQPGTLQMMYYDGNGKLRCSVSHMEGETQLAMDERVELTVVPEAPQLQLQPGMDTVDIHTEIPVQTVSTVRQEIPMVTGLELGAYRKVEEDRPSLVLCRAGSRRLWDIARENRSTVSAIRSANGLTGEPEKDRILLIPVP